MIKLIPHDVTPEPIVAAVVSAFVALVSAAIRLVYRFVNERVATVSTVTMLVLGVRRVYRNGVGVWGADCAIPT